MRSPLLQSLLAPGKLYWYRIVTSSERSDSSDLDVTAVSYVCYVPTTSPAKLVWVLFSSVNEAKYFPSEGKARNSKIRKSPGETLQLIDDETLARVFLRVPTSEQTNLTSLLRKLQGLEEGEIARIKKIRDL